ncbi:Imm52 family immunity protein [Streptomyces gobiensis]|uniref:Imm52 family immunity protein n=1 Tax=Streptomyces gobiensis TaxID=2875706 RepID=UPI001E411466|nr:Imm52 family immunity protein [Streptomyces gobiensis]UGY93372.1 hypothetical protein test1122_17735 [Streptomyces gobiensis]
MLDLVVRGFWGPRSEGPLELAERWLAFLERLRKLDPDTFCGWREVAESDAKAPATALDPVALAAYITAANPEPDAQQIGYRATVWTRQEGRPEVTVKVTGGGTADNVPQSVVVNLELMDEDHEAPQARLLPEALVALADVWDVDWGDFYDDDLMDAVEEAYDLSNSSPRCGRAVYLSSGRKALAPEDLPGRRLATGHGGVVIDLSGPKGEAPVTDTVIAVNGALRNSGALEELPYPMDRPKL